MTYQNRRKVFRNPGGNATIDFPGVVSGFVVDDGLLNSGEAVILRPETLTQGVGQTWTGNGDGVVTSRIVPKPITARASIKMSHDPRHENDCVFFEVVGLTDDECAYNGIFWDFGESQDFQYLNTRYTRPKDMRNASGFQSIMAWPTPGSKTVTCTIYYFDGAAVQSFVLTENVTVPDSDTVFAGATYVVSTDGDFTGAPAGGQYTSFSAAEAVADNAGTPDHARFYLKRGQDHGNIGLLDSRQTTYAYITDWGAGDKPLIGDYNTTRTPDLVLHNIRREGGYNAATGVGDGGEIRLLSASPGPRVSLVGCDLQNTQSGFNNGSTGVSSYIFDSRILGWENYGSYNQGGDYFGARGCLVEQDVLAVNGDEGKVLTSGEINFPDHGPFRNSEGERIVIAQCQSASFAGWSVGNDPGAPAGYVALRAHQAFARLISLFANACRALISENDVEGGGLSVEGSAAGGKDQAHLVVISRNYFLATAASGAGMSFGHTGTYVVNNVFIVPNVLTETNSDKSFFNVSDSITPEPGWLMKGCAIKNNTFIDLRSAANQRRSITQANLMGFGNITSLGVTLSEQHNILHAPNVTLDGEAGPIDAVLSTATNAFTPQYAGQRRARIDGATFQPSDMFTEFATPAGSNLTGEILDTSSFHNSVTLTADIPCYDFAGTVRGVTTSAGAFTVGVPDVSTPDLTLLPLYGQSLSTGSSPGAARLTSIGTQQAVTGATQANPVVITCVGHGYAEGDTVQLENLGGMVEVNDLTFQVRNPATDTFELYELDGGNPSTTSLDGSAFTAYTSGGTAALVERSSTHKMFNGGVRVHYNDPGIANINSHVRGRGMTSIVDLEEWVSPGLQPGDLAETSATGMAQEITRPCLFYSMGRGASPIAELDREFPNHYANFMRGAQRFFDLASGTIGVAPVHWDQGEAESAAGTTKAQWKASLIALQADAEQGFGTATGDRTRTIPFITDQRSLGFSSAYSDIAVAAIELHRETGGNILCAGPLYWGKATQTPPADVFFTSIADVHPAPYGYRLRGEWLGRMYEQILTGTAWNPTHINLQPTRSGTTITVPIYVPVAPLVIDTSDAVVDMTTEALANSGFTYSGANITSVTVVDDGTGDNQATIEIELDAAAGGTLGYAYNNQTNSLRIGNTYGPRGNIRDSETATASTGENLYNWLCIDQWTVT